MKNYLFIVMLLISVSAFTYALEETPSDLDVQNNNSHLTEEPKKDYKVVHLTDFAEEEQDTSHYIYVQLRSHNQSEREGFSRDEYDTQYKVNFSSPSQFVLTKGEILLYAYSTFINCNKNKSSIFCKKEALKDFEKVVPQSKEARRIVTAIDEIQKHLHYLRKTFLLPSSKMSDQEKNEFKIKMVNEFKESNKFKRFADAYQEYLSILQDEYSYLNINDTYLTLNVIPDLEFEIDSIFKEIDENYEGLILAEPNLKAIKKTSYELKVRPFLTVGTIRAVSGISSERIGKMNEEVKAVLPEEAVSNDIQLTPIKEKSDSISMEKRLEAAGGNEAKSAK